MSGLADRIRGIVKPSVAAPAVAAGSGPKPNTAAPAAVSSPPIVDNALARRTATILGGEWREGCLLVERRWTRTARHGRESIDALAERLEASAADAPPFFAGGAPARAPFVFFDLETTGLSGGAGTQAFLIGFASFDADGFVTRQYLMTRYADELSMLRTVAREGDGAGAVVSFNGRSFDAPLLETRYLFHRLAPFLGALPHIDVLHPARQFWKREDCSLLALERELLGHRRVGDVPGFEIPGRYFQFVRTGDARPLCGVLEHNRLDLLSLAALTARLLHLVTCGSAAVRDPREALALGHVYTRAGVINRAAEAYTKSLELNRAPRCAFDGTRIDALRALALTWRRMRRYEDAASCWQQLLAIRGCPAQVGREAAEALAIHSEHRLRDFAAARAYVFDRLEVWPAGPKRQSIDHRLRRLDRKLADTFAEMPVQPPLLDSEMRVEPPRG